VNLKLIAPPVIAAACALASLHAGASTNMFDPSVSSATKIDGSEIVLNGTLHDTNGLTMPWTTSVYAQPGECMRLFVDSVNFDPKLTVLAPDGEVFRDDDSGGSLRPLVKIASTPVQGWYTVQVAHFSGAPQADTDFVLKYGRFTAGNPNCANPTVPLVNAGGAPQVLVKDPATAAPAAPFHPVMP
jgi:hypothetical protein